MGKIRTSIRRKPSTRSIRHKNKISSKKLDPRIELYDPTEALLDEARIGRAIWECLKNGDSEGVIEIIQIHLEACNKSQLAKEAQVPKTTLYHSFRSKNPTIRTLAKLVQGCF